MTDKNSKTDDEASVVLDVQHLSSGVVNDASFQLLTAEVLVVMGPSGSGKSCLLKGIVDLIPNQGNVFLHGLEKSEEKPTLWRRKVQLIPAESRWWYPTAADHFSQPPKAELLQALKLEVDDLRKPIGHLSTGQKQRFALLRSLALKPQVLLLDEPTSSLDDETAQAVETCIAQYIAQSRAAAVWVTHLPAQAKRVGHRIMQLPECTTTKAATAEPSL